MDPVLLFHIAAHLEDRIAWLLDNASVACMFLHYLLDLDDSAKCDSTWEKGQLRRNFFFLCTCVCCTTTPKNSSLNKTFVCLSGMSHFLPTLTLN